MIHEFYRKATAEELQRYQESYALQDRVFEIAKAYYRRHGAFPFLCGKVLRD